MNFDENDPKSVAEFVWRELPRHKQFALGTVDDNGKAWVVCVNLSFDAKLNIFWKSLKDTEHSKHIAQRPDVSICIFSESKGVGDYGFYTYATAREATTEEEINYVIKHRYAGKEAPPASDFMGDAEARLYIAEISEAWINDDRHLKQPVDKEALKEAGKTNVHAD